MNKSKIIYLIASILIVIYGIFQLTYSITENKFLLYIMAPCILVSAILSIVATLIEKTPMSISKIIYLIAAALMVIYGIFQLTYTVMEDKLLLIVGAYCMLSSAILYMVATLLRRKNK